MPCTTCEAPTGLPFNEKTTPFCSNLCMMYWAKEKGYTYLLK
jgi:endogenous inhibitor of DNA gyrase (YacG/DUF329 family)